MSHATNPAWLCCFLPVGVSINHVFSPTPFCGAIVQILVQQTWGKGRREQRRPGVVNGRYSLNQLMDTYIILFFLYFFFCKNDYP